MRQFIFESVFFGFAVFTLLSGLLTLFKKTKNNSPDPWINASIVLLRWAGLFFILVTFISIALLLTLPVNEKYADLNRMLGPYWFAFWIYPFTYGFLSQLFWIQRIKKSVCMRFLYALLLLFVLHIERITILLASLHRDFIPSGWTLLYERSFLLSIILKLGIFAGLLTGVYFLKGTPGKKYIKQQ